MVLKNNFALTKLFDSLAQRLYMESSPKNMIFKCFNYIFKFDMLINKELVNKFSSFFFKFFALNFFLNSN